MPCEKPSRLAEHLAGEPVEERLGLGPAAVRHAEAETREGARRIEVEGEDRPDVAVQRAEDVAGLEREAGGNGDALVADRAVPLRDPAGQQHGLEARVELARQLHERVGAEPVFRTVHDRRSLRRESEARQQTPASQRGRLWIRFSNSARRGYSGSICRTILKASSASARFFSRR